MNSSSEPPPERILSHVLLPVAHAEDARESANSLARYDPDQVTALHVVEKGGGVPDKTPVEHSEKVAEESFAAVRDVFPTAESQTAYDDDVAEAIFDVAEAVDASVIAYRSRGGGRIMQFLSGDLSLKLVTSANRPVVALPREQESN